MQLCHAYRAVQQAPEHPTHQKATGLIRSCTVTPPSHPLTLPTHPPHTRQVLLVVPWLPPEEQPRLYPAGQVFQTQEEQAEYILAGGGRQWMDGWMDG